MKKIGQFVRIENSVAIVEVEGEYKLTNTVQVNTELDEAYRQGCTSVLVDFSRTNYIESSVTRDIIRTIRRVGEKNVHLTNATGRVLAAIRAEALDYLLVPPAEGLS